MTSPIADELAEALQASRPFITCESSASSAMVKLAFKHLSDAQRFHAALIKFITLHRHTPPMQPCLSSAEDKTLCRSEYTECEKQTQPGELVTGLKLAHQAILALGPFEMVQGDTIHRTNPASQQVLNSNLAWAVSSGDSRSALKIRVAVNSLNDLRDYLPSLIATAEAMKTANKQEGN